MNTGQSKRSQNFRRCLGLSLTLMLVSTAWAADNEEEKASDVEQEYQLGAYILDEDAWRFGKYTGLMDEGTSLLLDFSLESRPAWDSGETRRPAAMQAVERLRSVGGRVLGIVLNRLSASRNGYYYYYYYYSDADRSDRRRNHRKGIGRLLKLGRRRGERRDKRVEGRKGEDDVPPKKWTQR